MRRQIDVKCIDFVECDACNEKPGIPVLCSGCLHNRMVISRLKFDSELHEKNAKYYYRMCWWLLAFILACQVALILDGQLR
jgi:hypothetical protein